MSPALLPERQGPPWPRARVGDRVTYDFSAHAGSAASDEAARRLSGRLVLEVVSVRLPWVWLRVSFTDEAGRPLGHPRLARDLVLPMLAAETRPLEVLPEGDATPERATAAGRTWEAQRYTYDARRFEGPLEVRLYAVSPGPLYLTGGLLEATTTLAGFQAGGTFRLRLSGYREGTPGEATPPPFERPLGPGTYYDRQLNVGTTVVHRTCFAAERGYVLRAEGPAPGQGDPCPSFSDAEVLPLGEFLLSLPWDAVSATDWPPRSDPDRFRGSFGVAGRRVHTLTFESWVGTESAPRIRSETYATDPWDPELKGLPYEARFRPLADSLERQEPHGERVSESSTRLVSWGRW